MRGGEAKIARHLHKDFPALCAAPEIAAFYGRISTLSSRVTAAFLLSFFFIEERILDAVSSVYASFAIILGHNYNGQSSPEGELAGLLTVLAVICAYIPAIPPELIGTQVRLDIVRRCLTILPFLLLIPMLIEWTGYFLDIDYVPTRLSAALLCIVSVAVMSASVARLRI